MEEDRANEAGRSFRETIVNSEASNALIAAGDMALERIADVAGGVPVLAWVVAAGKTFSSVRDYFLIKRIAAFLADFDALSPEERAEVIGRLDREPEYAQRAAEALLTLIDRVDNDVKAVWVSRGLRAYAARAISAADLMRINFAIERLLICDAEELSRVFDPAKNRQLWGQTPYALAALAAGLASFDAQWEQGVIRPNEICGLFVRHILLPKPSGSGKRGHRS